MEFLPASIEAYLLDAGFTGTEVLVLKRLLEEDALTLRQLAAKTGKSTGILDQAVKKLLKKGIVTREVINDTPKFTLHSLQSISNWMTRDMHEKQDQLERRHENFEAFISSIEKGKDRPDMEHFEGEDGIKRAYIKLLNYGKELLSYVPVLGKEEDDPLREFRVQLFRERRTRNIFQRVIAHDTPLGRRYQSRDAFEYRKTLLVPADRVSIPFEQIIVGYTVGCFDHETKRASFIHYPHLANVQSSAFESIWKSPYKEVTVQELQYQAPVPTVIPTVALKTRVVSALREFVLSPKSIVAFVLFALLAGAITYGLHWHTYSLNLERIKEQARSIAATGAVQFEAKDIEQVHVAEDITKPEYTAVSGNSDDS